jgi:hypothetical protein
MDKTSTEEAEILARRAGETSDPVHRVSYSFRRDGYELWVYTWMEDGAICPSTSTPLSRSTGRC